MMSTVIKDQGVNGVPVVGKQLRAFNGRVTKFFDSFGFVDDDVFFQLSVVKGGNIRIGDHVHVECAYSEQSPFKWNATKVEILPQHSAVASTYFQHRAVIDHQQKDIRDPCDIEKKVLSYSQVLAGNLTQFLKMPQTQQVQPQPQQRQQQQSSQSHQLPHSQQREPSLLKQNQQTASVHKNHQFSQSQFQQPSSLQLGSNLEYKPATTTNSSRKPKVQFSEAPVCVINFEDDVDSQNSRCKYWEFLAVDRQRFRDRINRLEEVLKPILDINHRSKMFDERFTQKET